MMVTMKGFTLRLADLRKRVDVFEIKIQKERLPQYLAAGNTFMGKYLINKAVSYNQIYKLNLLRHSSVFNEPTQDHQSEADFSEKEVKTDGPLTASRLNYLTLYNTHYAYRVRTSCPFENNATYIFDFFIAHDTDSKLSDFNLFTNLWRETLLLSKIQDDRLQPVISYGQLPDGIIFREICEVSGCTLEEYIQSNRERIPPYT